MYPAEQRNEIKSRLCVEIATTNQSLAVILKAVDGYPELRTVMRWLAEDEDFRQQYARAKELQMELLAEEILDIADEENGDAYITHDAKGNAVAKLDGSAVQRSRLRVDTRRWLMSKLAPKKYGDKLDITSDNERLGSTTEAQRIAKAAALMRSAKTAVIEQPAISDRLKDILS